MIQLWVVIIYINWEKAQVVKPNRVIGNFVCVLLLAYLLDFVSKRAEICNLIPNARDSLSQDV